MFRPTILLALGLVCWISQPALAVTISKDVNDLKYFYFPTASEKIEIAFNNRASLEQSNIRSGIPTIVIVDGFLSDSTSPMSMNTKANFISHGNKNVVVLDWGRLSGSGLTLGNALATANAYVTVLGNVGPVGQRLAEFLEFLRVEKQIQYSDIMIVGHSLGAHIAGAAGTAIKEKYGASVGRIVGLDPAGPFFSMQVDRSKRLNKDDATFVDIYHTNRGTLGDSDHDTGTVNIYVNGGKNQPGCEEADSSGFAGYCSHSYSHQIFNTAFDTNVRACPCSGDACVCTTCSYTCSDGINVGPNIPTSATGRFHLSFGPLA